MMTENSSRFFALFPPFSPGAIPFCGRIFGDWVSV
jgi:hypothetical protein